MRSGTAPVIHRPSRETRSPCQREFSRWLKPSWDVLAAKRPYREPWPRTKIISHLDSQSGIDFDPQVVKRFLELEKEGVLPVSQDG